MHGDITVRCPFYEKENQTSIFCEGNPNCKENSPIKQYYVHSFANKKMKNEYIKAHCSRFPDMGCRYGAWLYKLYEKREEKET